MSRLNVIAWNTYAPNDDAKVLAQIDAWALKYHPDVFALTEAMTHYDAIHEWAEQFDYTLIQERPVRNRRSRGRPVDDRGDCALLLAPHVKVRFDWVAAMTRFWRVFSHNRVHVPHRYQVAQVKVRGQRWRIRASHWPTNGLRGGNAKAWLESAQRSRRWLLASSLPSIDVGDLNEKLAILATWFGQRFRVFGKGIDVAVTRNVDGCEWSELGKGGGDHHGRFYRFTA